MSQVRLGRFQEGLAQYRHALAALEALVKREPANSTYQHDLMQIYTHIGDVLGNPNLRSLGDTRGATEAYNQMLSVARHLYEIDPADQRAVSDYAIALTRVAAVQREDRQAEKLAQLRESLRLLHEVARVNPQNAINQWDMAHGYKLLGDALLKMDDRAGAVHSYQQSLGLAERLLKAGVNSPAPTLVAVCQMLATEAARSGDRETALARAHRALEVSDGAGVSSRKFLVPQAAAAMGLAYARLESRVKSAEDRRQAVFWLQKSLAGWRAAQGDPAFAPPHKRQMQQVEETLAEIR
jgi:tetratricopeptide (TPR) repeat protein